MKLLVDISIGLNIAGVILGVLLAIAVYNRTSGNLQANKWLSLLLIALSIMILNSAIVLSGNASMLFFYEDLSNATILTVGPLIFAYVRALASGHFDWKQLRPHLSPFFGYLVFVLIYHLSELITTGAKDNIDVVAFLIMNVQVLIYLAVSLKALSKHSRRIKENYSYIEKRDLHWIRTTLVVFVCVYYTSMVLVIMSELVLPIPDAVKLNTVLLFSFSIYYLGYRKLNEAEVVPPPERPKYQSSTLSEAESESYLGILKTAMRNDKMYLQSDLSIAQLAEYLNVQSRHISQVINQQLDENFHDFVNKYRVDEVKLRITNPEFQHLTIVGMALESGFKSRSAFQTAFKKHTGMTPSAYKSSI